MRRLQRGDDVGLAPEALDPYRGLLGERARVRADELDRGPSREHVVAGFPHLAHAAFTDGRDQTVAAERGRWLTNGRRAVEPSPNERGQHRGQHVDARPDDQVIPRNGRETSRVDVDRIRRGHIAAAASPADQRGGWRLCGITTPRKRIHGATADTPTRDGPSQAVQTFPGAPGRTPRSRRIRMPGSATPSRRRARNAGRRKTPAPARTTASTASRTIGSWNAAAKSP